LVGLLVYALSLGPACFLVDRGYLPQNPLHPVSLAMTCFYLPLNLVTMISPLDHAKTWYLSKWDRRQARA
jgi:hypothetical protein